MDIINKAVDERSECISILVTMTIKEYKELVYDSFCENGNLAGQRGVIRRSAAATKIRKRMQEDFVKGAVFPQVVIGLLESKESLDKLKTDGDLELGKVNKSRISIIDGMQRSNIYFANYADNEMRNIRVEFWVANKSEKLLYRMMVLNTGQVPWNTRRQVEVIFSTLSENIVNELARIYPELKDKIEIYSIDDGKRRSQAGKYNKASIIESYLAFNTRKVKVDVNDELADEFQRFDMMESIEKTSSFDLFVNCLGLLFKLDLAFADYDVLDEVDGQFKSGKDIFTSVPACIGFIVSCAEYIMGKISIERDDDLKYTKLNNLVTNVDRIISKLNIEKENNANFLCLEHLNAICNEIPKSNIGDETRRLFKNAFTEMIRYEEFNEIPSLEAFWRE